MRLTLLSTTIGFCTAIALTAAAPTIAETISDPEAGLSVTLPPEYFVSQGFSKIKDSVGVFFKSNDIKNSYCSISYNKPTNPDTRRHEANVKNWHERFGGFFVQHEIFLGMPIDSAGKTAGTNFDENYPLRPPKINYLHGLKVVFKTSDGYLNVFCEAEEKDIDKLRPVIETIVRGISLTN